MDTKARYRANGTLYKATHSVAASCLVEVVRRRFEHRSLGFLAANPCSPDLCMSTSFALVVAVCVMSSACLLGCLLVRSRVKSCFVGPRPSDYSLCAPVCLLCRFAARVVTLRGRSLSSALSLLSCSSVSKTETNNMWCCEPVRTHLARMCSG